MAGTLAVADDLTATWREFFAEIQTFCPRFHETGRPRCLAWLGTCLISPFRHLSEHPSVYTPGWKLNLPAKRRPLWS